ncbi:MAG: radical SAM protein [Sedimentibacter sp.]
MVVSNEGGIYLEKTCPEHGLVSTLIWEDSANNYINWLKNGGIDINNLAQSKKQAEQLFSLDDIIAKKQNPVSAALMTTTKCNANCPVCFTNTNLTYTPTLVACEKMLDDYIKQVGVGAPIEFCGGEPTTRDDLIELSQLARKKGFNYIQLNTNGFKIAKSLEYTVSLKKAGITTIYLGFDGFKVQSYIDKYGDDVLNLKLEAIKNCKEAGLAVVLVPCLVSNSNDDQLGEIIEFAKKNMPTVKGIYIQPISYFGKYPAHERIRLTIPKILKLIDKQTEGEIKVEHFQPGALEHPQCSFNGYFMLDNNNKLKAFTRFGTIRTQAPTAIKNQMLTKKMWLPSNIMGLSIGGMAFQDIWNIDYYRLSKCTIQIIRKDGSLIPLCAKYVTNDEGEKLFEGIN